MGDRGLPLVCAFRQTNVAFVHAYANWSHCCDVISAWSRVGQTQSRSTMTTNVPLLQHNHHHHVAIFFLCVRPPNNLFSVGPCGNETTTNPQTFFARDSFRPPPTGNRLLLECNERRSSSFALSLQVQQGIEEEEDRDQNVGVVKDVSPGKSLFSYSGRCDYPQTKTWRSDRKKDQLEDQRQLANKGEKVFN